MNKEYEINSATQAIVPINDNQSMIYEEESEYVVDIPANKIINYNCNFYGSSYIGRCEGTKSLIGIKSKIPIIIEESRNIIFFFFFFIIILIHIIKTKKIVIFYSKMEESYI